MITRAELTYRSKEPRDTKPEIFSTGGYAVMYNGEELGFDFEDMTACCRFKDDYLYIDVLQKTMDKDAIIDFVLVDEALRKVKKEDFTEVYYECFADKYEEEPVDLILTEMSFFDFREDYPGNEIKVLGDNFSCMDENNAGLEQEESQEYLTLYVEDDE